MNDLKYNSIIFDMDGVIINSMEDEEWKYNAVKNALEELNVQNENKSIHDALLGDLGYKKCLKVCEDFEIDAREAWTLVAKYTTEHRIKEIKENNIELFNSFKNFRDYLNTQNVKTGVISNAPMNAVELTIESFELKQFFDFYLGVRNFDDLQIRKPHPDHLEIARAELKREPCLYIGDAESDIIAAQRAGMDSAWIKTTETSSDVTADYEVKDLDELKQLIKSDKSE